ncbi:hypothetical protein V1264_000542 [Littorina saxatilis]|uniref:Uncharacterized protein n=1 Tax=Littorina saxatilis TaxID=31220 RepID=A0AAN9BZ58_9CAEN
MAGAGAQGGGGICPGLMWSIVWLLVLFFFAWPLAGLFAGLYILLLPFSACIAPIKDVCEPLLKGVQFPLICAQGAVDMKPMCS